MLIITKFFFNEYLEISGLKDKNDVLAKKDGI